MIKNFWFYNEIISIVAVSWFIAQFIKLITIFVKKRVVDFKIFLETGGMPSAHTAIVSALAISIGILEGFNSAIFAVALIFAAIVIYDALGVRQAAGDHARILNKIVPRVLKEENNKHLKTRLGHNTTEVIVGALLGLIITIIFLWNRLNLPPAIKNLFAASYLFNVSPGSSFHYSGMLLILFGILLIAGIVFIFIALRSKNLVYKKLFSKIYTMLLTIGAVGYLLLFFRYENVYLLSSRFLLFGLFLAFIVWALSIIYYTVKRIPLELKDYDEYLRKEKYVPKAKNH